MKKTSKNQRKAFEFLTLFVMTIGTVIGAGIYFKNNEVLVQTQNPIIAIILWLVVGIVCFLSILVFVEISSSTKHFGNGTISNWTKLFINRKTASFFSLIYIIIYIPSFYSLFTGLIIYYFLIMLDVHLSAGIQLTLYLTLGVFFILVFGVMSSLKPNWSKFLQIFGTIFKFIPLFIALIAGFVLTSKNGAMFNEGIYDGKQIGTWSQNNFQVINFFRGFGGILLAFDGYVFMANNQKTVVNKDVVPKSLMTGMLFAAVFYVIIAISLFLGSPDGSIFSLLKLMIGNKNHVAQVASRVIPCLIMIIMCFLNLNVSTFVGTISLESDADSKLLYLGIRRGKVSKFKSGFSQMLIAIVLYIVFILMGFFIPRSGFSGWSDIHGEISTYPMQFIQIISSVAASLSFLMIGCLIFAVAINRKTKKVKVDKQKGMVGLAIFSGTLIFVFVIATIYTFIDTDPKHETAWIQTTGFYFVLLLISLMLLVFGVWLVQELLFKKYPFENGFDGELVDSDPRPFIFKFNPIKNYYTKKESKRFRQRKPRSSSKKQ